MMYQTLLDNDEVLKVRRPKYKNKNGECEVSINVVHFSKHTFRGRAEDEVDADMFAFERCLGYLEELKTQAHQLTCVVELNNLRIIAWKRVNLAKTTHQCSVPLRCNASETIRQTLNAASRIIVGFLQGTLY